MIWAGKLPCIKDGRRILLDIRDMDEWVDKNKMKHLDKFFAGCRIVGITTDRIKVYILQRQEEGAENATINRELAAPQEDVEPCPANDSSQGNQYALCPPRILRAKTAAFLTP